MGIVGYFFSSLFTNNKHIYYTVKKKKKGEKINPPKTPSQNQNLSAEFFSLNDA